MSFGIGVTTPRNKDKKIWKIKIPSFKKKSTEKLDADDLLCKCGIILDGEKWSSPFKEVCLWKKHGFRIARPDEVLKKSDGWTLHDQRTKKRVWRN